MKIEEAPKKREIENVLPLVNVVFLLLIFFMVAGTFTAPELYEVDVPYSDSRHMPEQGQLKIILDHQGNLAINDQPVSIDTIAEAVNNYTENDEYMTEIQLKADANADALLIVELVERLEATDIQTVQIITH